jgi:acid stress-induced BolA-like protein IbaG/YrbA
MTTNELKIKLSQGFTNADITIEGDGCNCSALIISDEFQDLSLLERQKKVLALVNDEIRSGELHALSIKARTPAEANTLNT